MGIAALVVASVLVAPLRTAEAQNVSVIGLTCVDVDGYTTREEYGTVFWTRKVCTDYLTAGTGFPPVTFGDYGLCNERLHFGGELIQNVIDCQWSYRAPSIRDADRSFRRLFCQVMETRYGYDNDSGYGFLVVDCTNRQRYIDALIGA